jgi:hypothetical protein
MAQAITSAALVYTPREPRAIALAVAALNPAACLAGGETLLRPGASLVLDFGEELVGVIELTAEADGATTVELIEGEDLEEALITQDPFPPDHWYHQPRDILHVRPGRQTLRNQGRRAGTHLYHRQPARDQGLVGQPRRTRLPARGYLWRRRPARRPPGRPHPRRRMPNLARRPTARDG